MTSVPPAVADTVFASAVVVVNVPVATPDAFVTAGCVIVLLPPVTASTTDTPGTGLPNPSSAVTVTIVASTPSATIVV